eukprot:4255395-Alexandrium_andersonii.AAC.1
MSASLVGSEMCIRDRCNSRLAFGWSVNAAKCYDNLDPGLVLWVLGHWGICLLYTSDAADDM